MTYTMGVTLSAGDSLNWLKRTMFDDESFDDIVQQAAESQIGANGLLFAHIYKVNVHLMVMHI